MSPYIVFHDGKLHSEHTECPNVQLLPAQAYVLRTMNMHLYRILRASTINQAMSINLSDMPKELKLIMLLLT